MDHHFTDQVLNPPALICEQSKSSFPKGYKTLRKRVLKNIICYKKLLSEVANDVVNNTQLDLSQKVSKLRAKKQSNLVRYKNALLTLKTFERHRNLSEEQKKMFQEHKIKIGDIMCRNLITLNHSEDLVILQETSNASSPRSTTTEDEVNSFVNDVSEVLTENNLNADIEAEFFNLM